MKKGLLIIIIPVLILLIINSFFFRKQLRPQFLPPPEPKPPPEMKWDVVTDFSVLTPYVPLNTKHTRMHDGAMPELVPSNDYGMLLPYSSVAITNDGNLRVSKHGFVTIDGVVVTDLVYERVDRAHYPVRQKAEPRPAYRLAVNWEYGPGLMFAACALDGSWITPFDYIDIVFTGDAVILVRNYDILDIDVQDYDGKFLYNMRGLEWAKDISPDVWAGDIIHSISEGYGYIRMRQGGSYAYIDILTGQAVYTGYVQAIPFSEGFASVAVYVDDQRAYNRLWGYINKDFEMVIRPVYLHAFEFINGHALVCTKDGVWHVINTQGEVLLSSGPNEYAGWYGDSGFVFRPDHNLGLPRYYTSDFFEIKLPEAVLSFDDYVHIYEMNDGWLGYQDEHGFFLFRYGEEHYFADIGHILYADDEYIIYQNGDDSGTYSGVATIDGSDVLPLRTGVSVTAVLGNDGIRAFIENDATYILHMPHNYKADYTPVEYRLYNKTGQIITSGPGILSYDEAVGLYSVLNPDYSAWLDSDGNTIISIPLMSYTLD